MLCAEAEVALYSPKPRLLCARQTGPLDCWEDMIHRSEFETYHHFIFLPALDSPRVALTVTVIKKVAPPPFF